MMPEWTRGRPCCLLRRRPRLFRYILSSLGRSAARREACNDAVIRVL
jgi:hypothetical protein